MSQFLWFKNLWFILQTIKQEEFTTECQCIFLTTMKRNKISASRQEEGEKNMTKIQILPQLENSNKLSSRNSSKTVKKNTSLLEKDCRNIDAMRETLMTTAGGGIWKAAPGDTLSSPTHFSMGGVNSQVSLSYQEVYRIAERPRGGVLKKAWN